MEVSVDHVFHTHLICTLARCRFITQKALHSFCLSHVKMETMLSIFNMKLIGMICQKVKPNHFSLAQAECKSLISGLKTHQNLVWVFQSRELRIVEIFLYQDLSTNIDEEMGEINTGNVVSLSLAILLLFLMRECWEKSGVSMHEQGLTQECQVIQTVFNYGNER